MQKNRIQQIEDYARRVMTAEVAHDFQHADRVRCWAVQIAQDEGYQNLEVVEAAALLHDVGLSYTEERGDHGRAGAKEAARFLREKGLFAEEEIREIANAIRYHNLVNGSGQLWVILRDADTLDMLGAVGVMRAFTSNATKPEYNPRNVKGDTWEMAIGEFEQRFAEGKGVGSYIIDQVNFQISCYDNLGTETARRVAEPLVEFMKAYVVQLESEVNAGRKNPETR